jgi:raffinose/stachyose/melibiose transport system substrate-binding protein
MELKDMAYMDSLFRFYDLTLDYGLGAESIGFGAADQRESFAGGKSAMIKQGTWYTSLLKINPDLNMGTFAIPLDNDPSHTKFLTATTNYLAVNNDSPHVEEAKFFLEWIHKNMGTYFVEKLKVAPPYHDIELKDMGPLFNDMTEYTKNGMSFGYFGTEFWPDGFKTDIAASLQAYAAKVMTKEQALAELQKAYMDRAAASK